MKTFLIILLSFLLLMAAFLTRPGRREFVMYLLDSPKEGAAPWSNNAIKAAEKVTKKVVVKDRILWTEVQEENGKLLYTGVFSRFIPHGEDPLKHAPTVQDMARFLGTANTRR